VLPVALGSTPIAPQASRKACSFLSVNFVHYVPARRKNAISIPFCLFEHFRGFLAVSVPGTSIGVDLTQGHFEAAFEKTA
jgi:hypothetical protein